MLKSYTTLETVYQLAFCIKFKHLTIGIALSSSHVSLDRGSKTAKTHIFTHVCGRLENRRSGNKPSSLATYESNYLTARLSQGIQSHMSPRASKDVTGVRQNRDAFATKKGNCVQKRTDLVSLETI